MIKPELWILELNPFATKLIYNVDYAGSKQRPISDIVEHGSLDIVLEGINHEIDYAEEVANEWDKLCGVNFVLVRIPEFFE